VKKRRKPTSCECPCGCCIDGAKTGREGFEDDALCSYCYEESRKNQVAVWNKLGVTP
jgi:hypothetical protein